MHVGIEPLTAVRLVSVVAGSATVVLVAGLAYRVAGNIGAVVAAALAVVCPFFLVYGSLGLYEALATALVTAALYLQLRLAREPRLDTALLLGATFAAGTLTKETTVLALVLLPLSLVVFDWRAPGRVARLVRWCLLALVAVAVDGLGVGVMKLSPFYADLGRLRAELYPTHSVGAAVSDPLKWLDANWPAYRDTLTGYVTVPVIAAAVLGFAILVRRREWTAIVLLGWIAAPVVSATLLADAPYPRYVESAVPPLLVLASSGGVCAWSWAQRRTGGRRLGAFLFAILVIALAAPALTLDTQVLSRPGQAHYPSSDDEAFVTGWAAGTGWRQVADFLRQARPGRPLVVVRSEHVSEYLGLALRHARTISLVRSDDPRAAGALIGVENRDALPRQGDLTWRPLRSFPRPRGGTPIVVVRRDAVYRGRPASSPPELRRLIGGTDADYDAYVHAHPAVGAWAESWYEAHPGR